MRPRQCMLHAACRATPEVQSRARCSKAAWISVSRWTGPLAAAPAWHVAAMRAGRTVKTSEHRQQCSLILRARAPTVSMRGSTQQHGSAAAAIGPGLALPRLARALAANSQSTRGHAHADTHAQVTRACMPVPAITPLAIPVSCGSDGVWHRRTCTARTCLAGVHCTVHCVACRPLYAAC